jgi:hypothetical protein
MLQSDYRLCDFGDHLDPLFFCPPDSPSHGPILEAWTFHGAQHVRDCFVFYFTRTAKGEPWVREMSQEERYEHEEENRWVQVTRDMAHDAGDLSMEGEWIRW